MEFLVGEVTPLFAKPLGAQMRMWSFTKTGSIIALSVKA